VSVGYDCHGCQGGTIVVSEGQPVETAPSQATPAPEASQPTPAADQPALPPGADKDTSVQPPTSGMATLTVYVPSDAKVLVNGRATRSTGGVRRFQSSGLKPGLVYSYEVQVQFANGEKTSIQTKSVKLASNRSATLAFDVAESSPLISSVSAR
jgi:uncharacterized protein (TIGR03000 family)